MTWVDLAVLGVLALSAILAFARGLVREVLGIGAWIGAAVVAIWAFPYAKPKFEHWIGTPDLADAAAFGAVFLGALILLNIVSGWVGALVRGSALGGLDRTLGLVFGLVRGAALVAVAYIAAGMVVAVDHWPDPVLQARTLPFVYEGAAWVVARLPAGYQPHLSPPPAGRQTTAEDLLHALPQGRAVGHVARD